MPISFNKYINIVSGVGGAAQAATRDLTFRLFTTSGEVFPDVIAEFSRDQLGDIADLFGSGSEEYQRALFYFGFVSKSLSQPKSISYVRWANNGTPPIIHGSAPATIAVLQATYTAGTPGDFFITIGADTLHVQNLDFSAATTYSDVATALQSAIQTQGASFPSFVGASVSYNAVDNRFDFISSSVGDLTISSAVGTTLDAAVNLGWLDSATFINGVNAQSVTDILSASTEENNNFGSFDFIRKTDNLSLAEVKEAAQWSQAQNVRFQFQHHVTAVDAAAWAAELGDIGSLGLSLVNDIASDDYPEMLPCAVLAATDYTRRAAVQNYMYQQAELEASVTTTADSNAYDALNINYYGNTQQAGQILSFYQRGFLMGTGTDPVDMGVFANEQWLKDDIGVKLMNSFLGLPQIPASQTGRSQLLAAVQPTINQGLTNGAISTGKDLTEVQKIFITNITGNELSWRDVQSNGYWIDIEIVEEQENNQTIYVAKYTLIYSKNDVVRKVDGQHVLI